jgi:hypothetical protein
MIRSLLILCLILLSACANHSERWSAFNSTTGFQKTGQIEYKGIGGSGRQLDDKKGLENGLGGSGKTLNIDLHQAQANGLGGSGRVEPNPIENGLGGSGKSLGKQLEGKAAILGPISAFGSIWVNDRHIQLPDSTEYLIAGHSAKRSDLHLGQVVAVLADSIGQESANEFEAIEVHLLYSVIGSLDSSFSNDHSQLSILGQTILLTDTTRIINSSGQAVNKAQLTQSAQAGQRIAVSGLRKPNGEIQASLLTLASPQAIQLAGPISAINGQYWLGKQQLQFAQSPDLEQPIRMQGQLESGIFVVDQWDALPHNRIFELADEVWLEGFPLSDAEFFIEGFEVQLPEFTDDWFDHEDSMRIGIDRGEQEFWMDHQPPEDINEWNQDDWQQDSFDDRAFDDGHFNDGPRHDEPFYDDHEYDGPEYDGPEFNDFDDMDYYPPENDHQDHYYPDDYYPYEHNPPPRHP